MDRVDYTVCLNEETSHNCICQMLGKDKPMSKVPFPNRQGRSNMARKCGGLPQVRKFILDNKSYDLAQAMDYSSQ
ncbi:hypothetical protein D3C76_1006240 [compost metagenome]